jgi:hypothetical protein
VRSVATLDDTGMELMRQRERRERAEHDQRRKTARVMRRRARSGVDFGQGQHERTERKHRGELEQRLEREREYESAIMRRCRRASRAEQHREQCHRERDVERAVLPRRRAETAAATEQRVAHRHRFELQRDVRHDAEHGHRSDQRRKSGMATEPSRDEVGERTRVMLAREPNESQHDAGRKRVEQDQPDERRRQPPARTFRLRDGAVERPRRAVHAKRQRVDDAPMPRERVRPTFAVPRHREQHDEPDEAGECDERQGRRHDSDDLAAIG